MVFIFQDITGSLKKAVTRNKEHQSWLVLQMIRPLSLAALNISGKTRLWLKNGSLHRQASLICIIWERLRRHISALHIQGASETTSSPAPRLRLELPVTTLTDLKARRWIPERRMRRSTIMLPRILAFTFH